MNQKVCNGHGPEVSPIMIVSDYPTLDELKNGRALSGASGDMIDRLLRENKYNLLKCYKTNYVKCALPGFNAKNSLRSREALAAAFSVDDWDEILIKEIIAIGPNVILALGELALNFLTGEKGILRFRGSVLPLTPKIRDKIGLDKHIRIVPALHPRDIFPKPLNGVFTSLDYKKALRNINMTGPLESIGNIWIARDINSLIEYWRRARHGEFLVTDIETYSNIPTCASLCTDGVEAVSFPLFDKKLSQTENYCIIKKYNEILSSNIPKVNQNMKYDWTVLERLGFRVNNIVGDTMLAANTIYPELPKGLDFLTSIYTDIPYYKDEGKDYDPKHCNFDQLQYYNAKDSLSCWQTWKAQQQELEELNLKKFYFNFVQPLFFHYKKVDDRGIRIDNEKRIDLIEKYTNLLEKNAGELTGIYGKAVNVRSPKQVGIFIYDFLKCPVHTHITPSGNEAYSTDEDTLTNLYLNEVQDPIIKKVLRQIILCRKIESTLNLLETPFNADGRMRTAYNIAGTTTGRTSTSQSIGWYYILDNGRIKSTKLGTAFQKIPKHGYDFEDEIFGEDIREIFIPSEGYEFFAFDGSNAEGRVVCILADDDETLDYIEAGNDIHRLTASWIEGNKPLHLITKKERNIGKMARHAGHLGQSGAGLSLRVYKSIHYCNDVMRKFHQNAPKIQDVFQAGIQNLIEKQRFLVNPFGRRRDFFNLGKNNKHEIYKDAYSYIPQGTVSDHFKQIALDLGEKANWAHHLFEAHDGLMYEIPKGRRHEFAELALTESSREISFENCSISRERKLKIPIEMEWSDTNWYNMESYNKPKTQKDAVA